MSKVIDGVGRLHTSQRACGVVPGGRDTQMSAEGARNTAAGMGIADLDANFEQTVGLQFRRVANMEDWRRMLDVHSGKSSSGPGRPCVPDMASYLNCPAGRRQLHGDLKTGCGSKHPLGIERVCNAKTRSGLEFGLVSPVSGADIDVCQLQTDPDTYFPDGEHFAIPQTEKSCLWFCTSLDRKTIFDMPLARPLSGSVTPGPHLMKLFLEQEQRQANERAGLPDTEVDVDALVIDQGSINRLRSLATRRDEDQRQGDQLMRTRLRAYDLMSAVSQSNASVAGGDVSFVEGSHDAEAAFTIKTTAMTTRVTRESDRIYTDVLMVWHARESKRLSDELAVLDDDSEEDGDSLEWDEYRKGCDAFALRYFNVKKDLAEYHLRLLRSCFRSTRDSATIPAGYKAMFNALESGVEANGGSASIAFNGGVAGRGRQMLAKDRTVFGELQEFLRYIFVDCCKIDGRDRRLMDAIYIHAFDMYAPTAFVLIIASEKGKGKSVRAERMARILPSGWTSSNSAASARAGMNGNNSPSNGTQVMADEMLADLTAAECGERMEYYKTLAAKREYTIERTQNVKRADGTDGHVTYKIVTDHREIFLICTNMGQCFTHPGAEPTSGKEAMIQRTICLQARAEATEDSPSEAFEANLKRPQVKAGVQDFRLFTALVGFCRLAIMDCTFLQPDLAFASLIFKEGDRMLNEDYGMPMPEPRRLVKRTETLKTMCLQEAVARVFLFKQTAVNYSGVGCPDASGRGRRFDIAHLYEAIRTTHPTREMIIAAWCDSLEYSIGTSSHGVNVTTAVCEKIGFNVDRLFRQLTPDTAESSVGVVPGGVGGPSGPGGFNEPQTRCKSKEWDAWMSKEKTTRPGPGGVSVAVGIGARAIDLQAEEERMRSSRLLRNKFRKMAAGQPCEKMRPMEAIRSVTGNDDFQSFTNALFPTVVEASLFHKPKSLLQWAVGGVVSHSDALPCAGVTALQYKQKQTEGGAKSFDFAWLTLRSDQVVSTSGPSGKLDSVYTAVANVLIRGAETCGKFDMHRAGVADALFMLMSSENKRLCPGMPSLPWDNDHVNAFVDADGNAACDLSSSVGLAPIKVVDGNSRIEMPPHQEHPLNDADVRVQGHPAHPETTPLHTQLDRINKHCRLPVLQPLMSTNLVHSPPMRKGDGAAIEVNSAAALDHMSMVLEAILHLSRVPGLKGMQQRFLPGKGPPKGLNAAIASRLGEGHRIDGLVSTLPYAYDLMQMSWSLDLVGRFYNDQKALNMETFNESVDIEGLGGDRLTEDDFPEITLRYMGFPCSQNERTPALRSISHAVPSERPAAQEVVDVAKANSVQDIDPELLRYETSVALGRASCTAGEIEEHRRSLIGSGYMYGASGDLFAHSTWVDHAYASAIGRGNSSGAAGPGGDGGLLAMLDAECMTRVKYVERKRSQELHLDTTRGTTYRWLEAHPETSGLDTDGRVTGKRKGRLTHISTTSVQWLRQMSDGRRRVDDHSETPATGDVLPATSGDSREDD